MVALLLLALHPAGALLARPVLASSRPCLSRGPLSRGPPSVMRAAPPDGFEWGAKDRERSADRLLRQLDPLLERVVRVGNHVPVFTSLAYFGLISMTMQTMPMPAMVRVRARVRVRVRVRVRSNPNQVT